MRTKTYAAIQNGTDIPEPGIPESFRVLKHELQALALDVKFLDESRTEIIESLVEDEPVKAPSYNEDGTVILANEKSINAEIVVVDTVGTLTFEGDSLVNKKIGIDELNRLKDLMLKNEVISLEDF